MLHDSTKAGDLNMVSKLAGEKRCGYGECTDGSSKPAFNVYNFISRWRLELYISVAVRTLYLGGG